MDAVTAQGSTASGSPEWLTWWSIGGGTIRTSKIWQAGDAQFLLIAWALLLWPLLINGAPFYSDDSGSYLRGGEFGFNSGCR